MTYQGQNYTIYIHTNLTNGKVYIGQTNQQDLTRRWCGGHGYKECPYFKAAIDKYGWKGFRHEILETGLTEQEANEKEIYYISLYESTNPNKGYNIRNGGQERTQFSAQGMQSLIDHFSGGKNPFARKVRLYDLTGKFVKEFETTKEVAKFLDCANGNISMACRGQRATVKKHFCFYKEDIGEIEQLPPQMIVPYRSMHKKWKGVYQYSLDGKYIRTFSSQKSAAEAVGILANTISSCLIGKFKSAGGFMWRRASGDTSDIPPYNEIAFKRDKTTH